MPESIAAGRYRHRVLLLLLLLGVIMYLDRVCISIAGPRMQEELGIDPSGWGWVTGAFTLSYALFEMPGGALGDRLGPRRVLTRIVVLWSLFTSLTGAVSSFWLLVGVRFVFGMGEAGAAPNMGVVVARWFPKALRTSTWGMTLMALQVGGAAAPLLVVPIQSEYGWRASFFLFGAIGLVWAAIWYWWFRDSPSQMPGVSQQEIAEVGAWEQPKHGLPMSVAMRSANLWALMAMAGCAGYTLYFFQGWLGTYLVRARGYTETGLMLSSLPFVVGALANLAGGFMSDRLTKNLGLRWGRRSVGLAGYGAAAVFVALAMVTQDKVLSMTFLSLTYGGLTFAQPALMAVCLDIGGKFGGAATGAMNTAAYTFAFLSSVAYGYIVEIWGNYDAPFVPMIGLMVLATVLWLRVDPEEPLMA